MEQFARDTRHRSHESVEQIGRKFLCTQLPTFIDYEAVYPFIADDLDSVKFRAPNVLSTYRNHREIAPAQLSSLIRETPAARTMPVFVDYCAKVHPPPGKELLTFFLQGQKKKNLLAHVEAMGLGVEETQRLCRAIREYAVPESLAGRGVVESVGEFLRALSLGESSAAPAADDSPNESPSDEGDEDGENGDPVEKPIILQTPPAVAWGPEKDHWENPVLKAFKIEAGLSTTFSTEKTAKQVLVAALGAPVSLLDRKKHLGKFQEASLASRGAANDAETQAVINHLIDSRPAEIIETLVQLPEAQAAYYRHRPQDNRAWVKTLVREGLMTHEMIKILID